MARLLSVNLGVARASGAAGTGVTGIDKSPAAGPVPVADPGPKGTAGSGLRGDAVCNLRHHGGHDQAVYAYSTEDLGEWSADLGRRLASGSFGENLTTLGLDVSQCRIGERWMVGKDCVLQVTAPRIPCGTFASWLGERDWVERFTARAKPGTYLRVVEPGEVSAGDEIVVVDQPQHGVTVALCFLALTISPRLAAEVLAAGEHLPPEVRRTVSRRAARAARAAAGPGPP